MGFIISLVLVRDTTRFTELELRQDMEKQVKEKQQKKQEEGKERARANEEPTEEKREAIINHNLIAESNLNFKQVFLETSWKNRSLLQLVKRGLLTI